MQLTEAFAQTRVPLNFAGDRTNGGIWSNGTPEITTQTLHSHLVDFQDARRLASPPSVEVEGFQIADAPTGPYDWHDNDWVVKTYMPHCVDLVGRLTGAGYAAPVHNSILIRDTGDVRRAPAAQFVHIDQDREAAEAMLVTAAGDAGTVARYRRAAIFNVWRSLTPPPQDVPLALCDQRTSDEADWVVGKTIEPQVPYPIPYVSSVHNPGQSWYYFSGMGIDEALVFKNYDSDSGRSLGCLHAAFSLPGVPTGTVPRASAETRIAAFFE